MSQRTYIHFTDSTAECWSQFGKNWVVVSPGTTPLVQNFWMARMKAHRRHSLLRKALIPLRVLEVSFPDLKKFLKCPNSIQCICVPLTLLQQHSCAQVNGRKRCCSSERQTSTALSFRCILNEKQNCTDIPLIVVK